MTCLLVLSLVSWPKEIRAQGWGGGEPLALLSSPCGKCKGVGVNLTSRGRSAGSHLFRTPAGREVNACLVRHLRMHVSSDIHPDLASVGRQSPQTCISVETPACWRLQLSASRYPSSLYFSPPNFSWPPFSLSAVPHVCSPGPNSICFLALNSPSWGGHIDISELTCSKFKSSVVLYANSSLPSAPNLSKWPHVGSVKAVGIFSSPTQQLVLYIFSKLCVECMQHLFISSLPTVLPAPLALLQPKRHTVEQGCQTFSVKAWTANNWGFSGQVLCITATQRCKEINHSCVRHLTKWVWPSPNKIVFIKINVFCAGLSLSIVMLLVRNTGTRVWSLWGTTCLSNFSVSFF